MFCSLCFIVLIKLCTWHLLGHTFLLGVCALAFVFGTIFFELHILQLQVHVLLLERHVTTTVH